LARELASDQIVELAASILELAVRILTAAGVKGASISSCGVPEDETGAWQCKTTGQ
jgi:hypothetical protein